MSRGLIIRTMHTAAVLSRQIKRQQINSYMAHISDGSAESSLRPMVVIYSWLMAQEKHFTK